MLYRKRTKRTGTNSNGLVAVVLAAVFSLALAGCSSGGSRTAAPEPPAVDASLANARAAAMAAHDAAKKALDDVMADKDADMSAWNSAMAQVAAAKAASDQAAAARTAEAAQLAQRLAERAQAEAERYARMVTAARAAADLQAVKNAARAAYDAAKKALDAVTENKDADMASYDTAAEKVDAARAAADEAAAAETLEAAKAAQAEAEKAQADAEKYTGMVQSALDTADKLQAAKAAAKAAYDAAKKALDDVMAGKDADQDSYDAAAAQVAVARAASDQAQEAKTLEAAEISRELAEEAKTETEKYTAMVTTAHTAAQLKAARDAAKAAYDAAKQALDDVMDIKDTDMASYDTAAEKVEAARAASEEAQAAETVADAQAAQKDAEAARAEAQQYAGMVREKKTAADEMKLKADMTKSALTMQKAIDAANIPGGASGTGKYGFRTGSTEPDPKTFRRRAEDEWFISYPPAQKMKKAELPAVLNNLGGGYEAQLHVRTEEQDNGKTIVRNKHYYINNQGPDTVNDDGGLKNDQNFAAFGMWLKETEKDGVITYNNVQVKTYFPWPENARGATVKKNRLGKTRGTATFTGPAVGAYLHRAVKADGALDAATAGVFAADASLTAHFGGGDVPASKQFSVEGTISNFRLSGGAENNWTLELDVEDINTNANNESGAFSNGTTDGGGKEGTWYGLFIHDEDSQAAANTAIPGFMSGRFTGHFVNGAVHGGFAADKEEE